jgi:4,5-DOPA dioxygenase extradiol
MPAAMPALFVGHGSPMNAIEDNAWTRGWEEVAREIPRPDAILCISAHWEAPMAVTADERPRTIHDFGGFPQALFDVAYPAPGSPELAETVPNVTAIDTRQALDWGLDHGAWSVLCRMYPDADVPVAQLSLDRRLGPRWHYEVGRRLQPLRDAGVLVMGSGNIVHNLRAADFRDPTPVEWAPGFRDLTNRFILDGDHDRLIDLAEQGHPAINSGEHYLPLLYVLGAQRDGDAVRLFNDDLFAAISMTSVLIG